jgi:hypothetical protein
VTIELRAPNDPRPRNDPADTHQHMITIDVEKDRATFSVYVARKGASNHVAPHETERYSIYFGGIRPPDAGVDTPALEAVMGAVTQRVVANEAKVPVPEGM